MATEIRPLLRRTFKCKSWRQNPRTRGAVTYATLFFFASGGAMIVHKTSWSSLGTPWRVRDSDLGTSYAMARSLGQSWFGMVDSSLGAPYTADYGMAYSVEYLPTALTRILIHVFENPFTAINLLYILSFGLTAISTFWLCRSLKINLLIGFALSLSYAWLPYHFIRMDYGHTTLTLYFMLPIGIWILIQQLQFMRDNGIESYFPKVNFAYLIFLAILIGAAGTYYAFYLSLLMFCTIPLGLATRNEWRSRIIGTSKTVSLAICFMIPSVLHQLWMQIHRTESQVLGRTPAESITFGGSITRLLVPSGFPVGSSVTSVIPFEEFEWTVTPMLVAVGFWAILIAASLKIIRPTNSNTNHTESAVIFISFWALLFYTRYGLGLTFSHFVSPIFRAWNRLSIILSLLSLLFIGLRIEEMRNKILRQFCAGIVCVLAFSQLINVDEINIGKEPDAVAIQDADVLRSTALQIENLVKPGCKILQLPIVEALGAKNVNQLTPGNQYWLPLFAPKLRWSFGAPVGTEAGNYWPSVALQGGKELFQAAKVHGFCGAVFDRRGYVSDSDFFGSIAEFEGLAQNRHVDVGSGIRFVLVTGEK